MERLPKGVRRWRTLLTAGLAVGLLASGVSGTVAKDHPDLPEGYAFNVISENVPEPLGSEHESVEIYKRAALDISLEWGIKFVYDDRCAPRARNEEERLIQAGAPLPTELPPPPPTRVFDNLYYVGLNDFGSWALVTKGGEEIYVFDGLNNAQEGEQYIAGGLRTHGFDPANIKGLFIMHGHADHWGAAKYLQDTFGTTLYAGEADWPVITQRTGLTGENITFGPVMLGDTEVTFLDTPGHTIGTVSAIIPVTFAGEPHVAAYLGGLGYPRNNDALLQTEIESLTDFTMRARMAGADVFITNHSHTDATVPRLDTIVWKNNVKNSSLGDMLWGPEYVTDLLDVTNLCARAQYARQQLPNWPSDLNVDYGELNWAKYEASLQP